LGRGFIDLEEALVAALPALPGVERITTVKKRKQMRTAKIKGLFV